MAKKKVQEMVVFSNNDIQQYENVCSVIADCQNKSDGLAERIAGQLYICSRKELYKIDGFTSMGEWATSKFEISPGTCSDAINTYSRFGSKDVIGEIDDKYKEFMFSTLIAMKKLSDDEIEELGINPLMSRSQVKKILESRKELEDRKAKLAELDKNILKRMDLIDSLAKDMEFTCLPSGESRKSNRNVTFESARQICPNLFLMEDKQPSVSELEDVLRYLRELYDGIKAGMAYMEDVDGCTVFRLSEQTEITEEEGSAPEEERPAPEEEIIAGTLQPEPMEESEQAEECEQAEEENHTCPIEYIRIRDYTREDGSIDKKRFLADVWEATQGVINHENDVLLTFGN